MQNMTDCWQSQISITAHQHSQKEAGLLAEIERLKSCNQELQKSLERESALTNKSEESLITGVTDLLKQFVSQKECRMGSIFSNIQTELVQRASGLQAILKDEHHAQMLLTQDQEQSKANAVASYDRLAVTVEQNNEVRFLDHR